MSKEFQNPIKSNKGKTALLIIQGKNSLNAGIWDMQTSMIENFESGTILP